MQLIPHPTAASDTAASDTAASHSASSERAVGEPVVGVVGGRGGVGTSLLTAVLAAVGARRGRSGHSVLVDLEAVAGGIDVLLGIEGVPGTRWSGLRLSGGHLQPSLLAQGLPRWGPVMVLAADTQPPGEPLAALLAAASQLGPVVVELGRGSSAARGAAMARCAMICLICRSDVVAVTAARAQALALRGQGWDAPIGMVVRRHRLHAPPDRVAQLVGGELIGVLPENDGLDTRDPLRLDQLPSAMLRVAGGVFDALAGAHHG